MSGVEPKSGKPAARATRAEVEARRAEALRLWAGGLTAAALGERLGVSAKWAGDLLKPVPPNRCRACGGPIEPRKQYHPHCRPSHRPPAGRPSGPPPRALLERRYGLWAVVGYAGAGKWLCRCRCGVEVPVAGRTLRGGTSRGCRSCAAKERWARAREGKGRPGRRASE